MDVVPLKHLEEGQEGGPAAVVHRSARPVEDDRLDLTHSTIWGSSSSSSRGRMGQLSNRSHQAADGDRGELPDGPDAEAVGVGDLKQEINRVTWLLLLYSSPAGAQLREWQDGQCAHLPRVDAQPLGREGSVEGLEVEWPAGGE